MQLRETSQSKKGPKQRKANTGCKGGAGYSSIDLPSHSFYNQTELQKLLWPRGRLPTPTATSLACPSLQNQARNENLPKASSKVEEWPPHLLDKPRSFPGDLAALGALQDQWLP